MKRIITITLIGLALCARSASAESAPPEPWFPVTDARVSAALAIARDFWGAEPNCASPEVFRARLPWQDAALGEQPGCRMWLSWRVLARDRSPASLRRREDAYLCAVVVHEYGHWLGFGHVRNRHSIMFAGLLEPKAVPACGQLLTRPRMAPSRRISTHERRN